MELINQLIDFFSDFADPKKRVFVGYLFLSVLIAFVWLLLFRGNGLKDAVGRIFNKKIFFSKSAIADYKLFIINQGIATLISPLLLTQLAIATAIYFALHDQSFLAQGHFEYIHSGVIVTLFSVTMFVVDDLTKYLVHRWMHRIPLLWAIHKVHHSAETLTPITVYRVHPLEGVLYASRSAVAQGITLPIFIFLFGGAVDLYTVLGVNVIVFVFHVTGSNLRHSHIDIRYWPWLEKFLISPAQHQLHHSVAEEHHDKNFGAALAIWDWMFGTLHLSEKEKDLTFGLDPSEASPATGLKSLYMGPLVEIFLILRDRIRQGVMISKRMISFVRKAPSNFR